MLATLALHCQYKAKKADIIHQTFLKLSTAFGIMGILFKHNFWLLLFLSGAAVLNIRLQIQGSNPT